MSENISIDHIRSIISQYRKNQGYSYQDLSDITGIPRSTLQRYETGSIKKVPYDKLKQLYTALNIPESTLYSRQENKKDFVRLPVLGSIRAGSPILAQENIEAYEITDINDISDDYEYFYLKVCGDSMKDAGILPNDRVLVRSQSDVESGDIAIALIDGECATVKRIIKQNGSIILKPENSAYDPMSFSGKEMQKVKIIGKVILAIHRF